MVWLGIWVHPYTVTSVWVGVDFRKIGAWLCFKPVWCCSVMVLRMLTPIDCTPLPYWMYTKCFSMVLRLLTPIDCIPQPYWMYTKCFSSLRCCGWAYGYTLMLYYMCRWGWILGKMGYGRACMMLRCHGFEAANPHWLHPTSIFDVYKVF